MRSFESVGLDSLVLAQRSERSGLEPLWRKGRGGECVKALTVPYPDTFITN